MSARRRLPTRRRHEKQQLRIGGHTLHVSISSFPDGKPAEIFIDMHKQGAPLSTFAHAFAMAISIGLQYGIPAEEFQSAFAGLFGDPGGLVEGSDEIESAASIPDLVAKLLVLVGK